MVTQNRTRRQAFQGHAILCAPLCVCLVLILNFCAAARADIQTTRAAARSLTAADQATAPAKKGPQVSVPTRRSSALPGVVLRSPSTTTSGQRPTPQPQVIPRTSGPLSPGTYPWRLNITATVFWIGESASARNPVDNHRSSWDSSWRENFGGFDDPDPLQRTPDFRPKGFIPRQNPFYVALPYNDVSKGEHKPEAARVIPWFRRDFTERGQSVCKGKWVQIIYNKRSCFAQWEDCGPFTTEDWPYVFGDKPPTNTRNKGAGIDISPAVRDYLGIPGGTAIVHWRFVEFYRIPRGPWSKWGENNPFVNPSLAPQRKSTGLQERRLRQRSASSRSYSGSRGT